MTGSSELEARIEYALRRLAVLEEAVEALEVETKGIKQTLNRLLLKIEPAAVKKRVKKQKEGD